MRGDVGLAIAILIFLVLLCNPVPGDEAIWAVIAMVIAAIRATREDAQLRGPAHPAKDPIDAQVEADRTRQAAEPPAPPKSGDPVIIDVEPLDVEPLDVEPLDVEPDD